MDKYSPISPNNLYLTYDFINKTEYIDKLKYNAWTDKIVNFNEFDFPLTTDYKSLSEKSTVKTVGLTKYVHHTKCKGFNNASNTSFVVNNIHSDDSIEIYNVTLYVNTSGHKNKYNFIDKLNKLSGEVTRSFTSSNQEITNNIKAS